MTARAYLTSAPLSDANEHADTDLRESLDGEHDLRLFLEFTFEGERGSRDKR